MGKPLHEVCADSVRLPFQGISKKTVKNWLDTLHRALDLGNASITLILTTDGRVREINRDYRKKDRPTDVISFAYRDEPFPLAPGSVESLGDIYISLERARAQAEEYGVSAEDELKRLLAHGVLHLAGYDHERSPAEARRMRRKEAELLPLL